jgi:hypothetical protein
MEKRINLIPSDMAVPPKTVKLTKMLNKAAVMGEILLVVLFVTLTSIFVFFFLEQKKVSERIEISKQKISELETSEQRLILAKDRLEKIARIQATPSIQDDIKNFSEISNVVLNASGSALVEASIQNTKTELSVKSETADSLATFLEPVTKLKNFKSIILTSLGFGPASGFVSDLLIKNE